MYRDEPTRDPNDKFFVVVVNSDDRLRGADPCMAFQERTLQHSEMLVTAGMRPPEIVSYPVEVYSLSYSHHGEFAKYGVANVAPWSQPYPMALYFFSSIAFALAVRHGISMTVANEIPRRDLPSACGSPVPFRSHVWHDRIDIDAYAFAASGLDIES